MNAIELTNISKEYEINKDRRRSFKEIFLNSLRGNKEVSSTKTVLDEVNLKITQGEMVGIMGDNGAGKSTLLKIIGGILNPTKGEVKVKGKVATILEVGIGFHPDLTGRENAYIYGSLLGISRKEMSGLLPGIIEFSEVGEYIDVPLRKYSSGMKIRLAFSVATSVDPDILLLDEVFAVGDQHFKDKSKRVILDFVEKGKTVILVSHNKKIMSDFCEKILYVNKEGKVTYQDMNSKKKPGINPDQHFELRKKIPELFEENATIEYIKNETKHNESAVRSIIKDYKRIKILMDYNATLEEMYFIIDRRHDLIEHFVKTINNKRHLYK